MSWIVTDKETGQAVLETYSTKVAKAINRKRFDVTPAGEYLAEFNRSIKERTCE